MKLPALLLAPPRLAACSETRDVANQFEKTGDEIANTANTIESATENNIRAAENALDQNAREWQNKSLEVNVSVVNGSKPERRRRRPFARNAGQREEPRRAGRRPSERPQTCRCDHVTASPS